MTKILGMGNALVDIMTSLTNDTELQRFDLPKGSMQLVDKEYSQKIYSETKHFKRVQTSGGSAANTIHALAKLGIHTSFIGKVGNDELGNFFKEDMLQSGINPMLLSSKTETGKAIALVSPDSERTFATFLGAAVELTPDELNDSFFKGNDYFHIEGYLVQNHALIEKAVAIAKSNNLKISLDLASYNVVESNLEFLKRIVNEYVDILFANEEEAKAFTGKEGEAALDDIAQIAETAIVKIGKKGSWVKRGNDKYLIQPIDAKPIDTTGAGDLYAGGFLYGLAKGYTLDKCGDLGSLLSGKVIEVIGAKIPDSAWEQIKTTITNRI